MIKTFAIGLITVIVAVPAFAAGNAAAGHGKSMVCTGCHGPDGNAVVPTYPKLAGQNAGYLLKQLEDFKAGIRKSPIMSPQAASLKKQDMEDLAAYFSQQKRTPGASTDPAMQKLGERIYRGGIEPKSVPACMSCHSPTGAGNPPAKYPSLASQNAGYVVKTLEDFHSGARGSNPKDTAGAIMDNIAKRMDDKEIKAVADYISSLH